MKEDNLIKLKGALKEHIWGGTKIHDVLHKDTGDKTNVAESWEISTHPDGQSIIDSGKYSGKTLNEYFDSIGWGKLGEYSAKFRQLPVMVKYIDATGDLSIQVHPDDEYARIHENDSGKNEIWFIVGAEKDAFIYLGFSRNVTREEVVEHINAGTLAGLLNKVHVKRGEVFYIPAGTVHAIGKGCLICEIQQSSNVTYRVFDYGRLGLDGKPRELHIDKALDVMNFGKYAVKKTRAGNIDDLGEYFNSLFAGHVQCGLFKYEAKGEFNYSHSRRCISFAITYKGKGLISCNSAVSKTEVGDTWLLNGRSIKISGKCKVIIMSLWG